METLVHVDFGERKVILLEGTTWFKCASSFIKKTWGKYSQEDCLVLTWDSLLSASQTANYCWGTVLPMCISTSSAVCSVHSVTDLLHFLVKVFWLICIHIMPCSENGLGKEKQSDGQWVKAFNKTQWHTQRHLAMKVRTAIYKT